MEGITRTLTVRLFMPRVFNLPSQDRGLNLGDREFSSVLEGLGGRVRDADRAVVDSALEALGEMYQANPNM